MPFKESVYPVNVVEVAVCEAHGEGFVVTMDFQNRGGEVVSLSLPPEKGLELGEKLKRAYQEYKGLFN